VVPLRLRLDGHELAFLSVTTVFGTPMNVTVAELAIEAFLPADTATAALLRDRLTGPPG
ncbi:transcriptional regulator, partial [Nocardia tengchongensis]